MRLSPVHILALSALIAAAGIAIAQPPPPPPPGSGDGSLPPLKQKQISEGGDRSNQPRPRRAGAPMPAMTGAAMPEVESTVEEPVTASGNIDLWRARIAEQRSRKVVVAAPNEGRPH